MVVLADMMVETFGEGEERVTAWPRSSFKARFPQRGRGRLGCPRNPPRGRAEDPPSRLQAAHRHAEPGEQAQTELKPPGKPRASSSGGKNPSHQLVDLRERGILNVQPVCGDAIQGCVVKNHLQEGKKKKKKAQSSVKLKGGTQRKSQPQTRV